MEGFATRITYRGAITRFLSKRDWNQQIVEPSWVVPLRDWKHEFRPRHFTVTAQREYDYTPRSGQNAPRGTKEFWRSYFGQKLRKLKHAKPLVYTGELMAASAQGYFRATSKSGKYVMPGANKANFRPPGSKMNMREELTKILPREEQAMARAMEREMIRRLRETKAVIRKTIGGI